MSSLTISSESECLCVNEPCKNDVPCPSDINQKSVCKKNSTPKTIYQRMYHSVYTWSSLSFVAGVITGAAVGYKLKK
jgi:hypothetical protein